MALKDWEIFTGVKKTREDSVLEARRKDGKDFIEVDGIGKEWEVETKKLAKDFKTKKQALEWAKHYMRTH